MGTTEWACLSEQDSRAFTWHCAAAQSGEDLSPLHVDKSTIGPDTVTLRWSGTSAAAIERLMKWSWQVRDGVLLFPGIHAAAESSQWWLRVPIHNGVMRTFLQHNRVQPRGEAVSKVVKLDENKEYSVSFQPPIIRAEDHRLRWWRRRQ